MNDKPICVITHPLGSAGENATRTLLDILSSITSVSLVTANLPEDSTIRTSHEVVEVTAAGVGQNVILSAVRFVLNQLRMAMVIRRRDEPTVLFYGATAYLLPVIVAKMLGRTVIIEPRGDVPLTLALEWERRLPAPLARWLAKPVRLCERTSFTVADAIITYTPGMADELNLDPFRGKVFPHGARYVDTDRFRPTSPYAERKPVVGYVGRLDEEKGIRPLAKEVRKLTTGTFRFVGDGDLRPWLETYLDDEIAAGTVDLTGWVDHDEVAAELTQLKLVVLPSHPTEGLPTTILEAFSCGTPVYAAAVSGVPDVVREGETGFLMEDPAAEDLAGTIESILGRDDLDEISENCRALVESTYTLEAAVERYRQIFKSIYRS